ncbi:peptidylprolyl isomerase [Polynucleobacter sp. MWH-Spelu-300-X4]|uniref:FKBP-type peptidyl-prolyl cis-trans isomerase n=1 Tax=Polynucleobacter sp. MWH-Spelu-300-X4 TaxID=2689109 RepID=UPI001BFD136E|nr:peptidylprolyl isomerase [Polynucleobacter sp. MWH-Spelu-300-X4]QWD79487.1 peptidylprolyl isomerase [Polynucleobacter sp. MWH-Spelu-300-X4]
MTDINTSPDAGDLVVTATSYLTLNYRIGLPEGGDLINTFEDKPATLMMGTGQFSPGLEQALLGMRVGERKTFTLDPESSYGVKNPELVRRISLKTLHENSSPEEDYLPGDMIEFNAPNGATYSGTLVSMSEDSALFDFNHPLAGKTIQLEAQIIGIL